MKRSFLALAATLLLSTAAFAQNPNVTLWDQAPDGAAPAGVDQSFADFPDFSTFIVSDVQFGSAVIVDSITTYFTNINLTWPQSGTGTGVLNIFADDGALDTEDPLGGTLVSVDFTATTDGLSVTANGLDLALAAGTYWIGLTPDLEFGTAGQEFHQGSASAFGSNSFARNPGDGFGFGTDWFDATNLVGGVPYDAAITVVGKAVPEPTTAGLLALACVGLVTRRRR